MVKATLLTNVVHSGEHSGFYVTSAKYIMALSRSDSKLNLSVLKKMVATERHDHILKYQNLEYRWADDPIGVAGYSGKKVAPLNIATPMPLIVDERIANLEPG